MPQQNVAPKQQPKVSAGPSQGLLQRIFGSDPMPPELQEGIRIARAEDPTIGNIQTYGPLSRFLMPDANAYTSPGRNIYLNPATMQGFQPQEVADTIMHEQTHVNQMKQRGYGPTMEFMHYMFGGDSNEPYGRRPDEMEAFQTEQNRQSRMGRMPGVMPSFDTGEMYVPKGDINLPVKTGPSSSALRKLQGKNAIR